MSKIKSVLALLLVVALTATIAVAGTLAYLQDSDSEVNVMTLGQAEIKQHEKQRVDMTQQSKTEPAELEDFKQKQMLYPAVNTDGVADDPQAWAPGGAAGALQDHYVNWGDFVTADVQEGSSAWNGIWSTGMKNVLDKFVFVENTGTVGVYYRTIILYEYDETETKNSYDQPMIHFNLNGNDRFTWKYGDDYGVKTVEVEGEVYGVLVATYNIPLLPGTTSRPSLLQVGLDGEATNEIVAQFGETYDILVLSQAVQVEGFAGADAALTAGYGEITEENLKAWFGDVLTPDADAWDGTADTSWYNDTDNEFVLTTAEQLAGLAELVDGGNSFAGKTIKLAQDLDLYAEDENGNRISFDPIGDKVAFEGTFDGQGNTIENLYQSGWDFGYEWGSYGSVGLFGELKNATVKNVTISGAESLVEGGDVGGITGSATGTCVFENITLEDSAFATYNNGNGGIIGWSGAGNYTFKNITIEEDVVLAGLWGSFDSSIGGVVGQGEPGATYNFENVNIACRLDVYNDCTASYDYYNYRMCGMIIGRLQKTTTIDGTNYPDMSQYNITCTDVTVTYGEWANYHYCDPTPGYNNGRGMRVEPGYSYDGLPEDYDHTQCTTHHNALIAFDQIFGGAQLGVKGLPAYDGVTVIYNNK